MDNDGNTIWTNSHDCGNVAIAKSIIQTQDNGYALTGYASGNGYDIIVMKTDENGDSLWTRTYDGYGLIDTGKSITEDSNGNIMVTGEIIQNRDIIGFLWYLDEDGNTIWSQEVDESLGHSHYSVISLPDNNFIAYCYSGSGGYRETTIYSFDDNYNINWQSEFEANVARGDKSISSLNSEHFVFPIREIGGAYENNMGIVKTDSSGQITDVEDCILEIPVYKLSNYPNPFRNYTKFNYYLPLNIKNPIIEIYNLKGQNVKQISDIKNNCPIIWDGTDQFNKPVSSGVYLYKLNVNGQIKSVKKCLLVK